LFRYFFQEGGQIFFPPIPIAPKNARDLELNSQSSADFPNDENADPQTTTTNQSVTIQPKTQESRSFYEKHGQAKNEKNPSEQLQQPNPILNQLPETNAIPDLNQLPDSTSQFPPVGTEKSEKSTDEKPFPITDNSVKQTASEFPLKQPALAKPAVEIPKVVKHAVEPTAKENPRSDFPLNNRQQTIIYSVKDNESLFDIAQE